MSNVNELKGKRKIIKGSLTRCKTYVNSFDPSIHSINELELRRNNFKGVLEQFSEIQTQLELLDDTEFDNDERESFENSYYELLDKINSIISQVNKNIERNQNQEQTSLSNYSTPGTAYGRVRLPKIELPKFNGVMEEWYSFKDTFSSLIHSNNNISPIEKFNYLKSSLSGDAAEILHSLEITEENYQAAWDMLNERFDNKRLIIQKHLHAIHSLPVCIKETYHSLRIILDGIHKHIRALSSLKRPTEYWDDTLVYLITRKLDAVTNKAWESSLERNQIPTLKDMTDFLTHRCQILDAVTKTSNLQISNNKGNPKTTSHISVANNTCPICHEQHPIFQCDKFMQSSVEARFQLAKNARLCINCLKANHTVVKCKSSSCRKCKKRHNTLLHRDETNASPATSTKEEKSKENTNITTPITTSYVGAIQNQEILLATAKIIVYDSQQQPQEARVVLDSCSQSSFVTDDLVRRLGIPKFASPVSIIGINQSSSHTNNSVNIKLKSRFNNYRNEIQCLILNQITSNLPLVTCDKSTFNIPPNIKLADPEFFISSKVDMLLGAEIFWNLLCVGKIEVGRNKPIFQKTHFGWIVSGRYQANTSSRTSVCNLSKTQILDNKLTKFWQLEEYAPAVCATKEEKQCEEIFTNTFRRNNDGRFIVQLPVKSNTLETIGDTYEIAKRRFHSLERKFSKQPELKLNYSNFIHEYIELNHMKESSHQTTQQPVIYLPHHGVENQSSSTTKLRVVFDGSAKSSTGISLNDALMVGPTLQEDLISIVLRFRLHRYAITADITKMYRQVLIDAAQTSLQRILWRDNPVEELKSYDLQTVTYGTASASYLAIRALQQLAVEEEHAFPIGAKITCRDFYVDDLLTGTDTIKDAETIINEVNQLLQKGGFILRKWASNFPDLIKHLQSDNDHDVINLDKNEDVNTLGLQWNTRSDTFKFSIPTLQQVTRITKRNILSDIAQLFDPLGLLAPIIVIGKLVMQKNWQLNLNWDESVPTEIHTIWCNFRDQLGELNSLNIPRRIINCLHPNFVELHGFCDASESAYGACIYMRVSNNECTSVSLICAKSRVAPLKTVSLPRLELNGAVLLARLLEKVIKSLKITPSKVYCWSDSTIVLSWISSPARNWKTFVSNRVSEIQELTSAFEWHHVNSADNPADIISRGKTPAELIHCSMWWNGPQWLSQDSSYWLEIKEIGEGTTLEQRNLSVSSFYSTTNCLSIFHNFSDFNKIVRIIAYCLRFKNNLRNKIDHNELTKGPLTVQEVKFATICVIRAIQSEKFKTEKMHLINHGCVNRNSKLVSLNPFLDSNHVIRVGGRLACAQIQYNQRHPMLLPKDHIITKRIIKEIHINQLHAGVQGTLAAVRLSYWPINGKNITKQEIRDCITCVRAKPISSQQLMGNLPSSRVSPSRPFANCGVDYFGPFSIRTSRQRNSKCVKGYGAVFICMVTKAIHIEVVSDLTTEAFIASLKRFISRRGKPSKIFSDNATNFVGANNELNQLHKMFNEEQSKLKITGNMHQSGISWHFVPPRSPHFGGVWEAAVKSIKHHIVRIVGNAALTLDELTTVLVQIEGILNSRPLTALSNDPNDLSYLTPAHFLIGDSLNSTCEPELLTVPANRLSRWQLLERLKQQFWRQWHREYLSILQPRQKWKVTSANLIPGTMVLVREDNIPPFHWPIGRILEVHPGADGLVRAATVKTSKGLFKRAITNLWPLPIESSREPSTPK